MGEAVIIDKSTDIVEKINIANEIKYGPRQECCNQYLAFCRCKNESSN